MGKTPPINGWSTSDDPWTLENAFKTKRVPENESVLTDRERKKRHHFSKVVKLETFKKALLEEKTRQAVQAMGQHDGRWDYLPNSIIARQPLERIQWLEGEIYNLEHDEAGINTREHYHQVWSPPPGLLEPQPHWFGGEGAFVPPPPPPRPLPLPPRFAAAFCAAAEEVAMSSWQVYQ